MAAKFTNLRPAETKPLDVLLALHTPLYPWGETTPFFDSVAAVGIPAAVPLAATRIATEGFQGRAWYALMGSAPTGSDLGGPLLLSLARLLARTDSGALLDEIKRRRLSPAMRAAIDAASTEAPSIAYGTVRDDLLAMILLPGVFVDYRRIANRLLVLAPRAGQLGSMLALPIRNQVPAAWRPILFGRITIPWQIGFRPPPHPLQPGIDPIANIHDQPVASLMAEIDTTLANIPLSSAGQDAGLMHSLHNGGLNAADARQIDMGARITGTGQSQGSRSAEPIDPVAGKREAAPKPDEDAS